MTLRKYIISVMLTLAIAVWAGCDGGGGGDDADNDGGVSGVTAVTDVSRGAIDGIASITMNSKTYQADDSTPVEGDDNPSFSDLQEGMVVMVEGGIDDDTGLLTATNIKVEESVKGPVTQAMTASAPLMTLHQTILITAQTIVDDNITSRDPANLAVNDLVEVHGNVLVGGVIEATFIEAKQPADLENWKVRGVIDSVGADSFTIGSLTVDTSAADLTDLPGGPQVGQFVEVKADPDSLTGTTLAANKVETDELEVEDDIELEVEGFVTSVNTAGAPFAPGNSFTIGAQRVETSGGTEFLGGLPTELMVGVKVEAEGASQHNVIQAEKVKFKESVRVEGNLVDTANPNVFTIAGLSSIEVEIDDAFTDIEDGMTPSAGDHVRVRGREVASDSANRRVLASRIEVRDPDDDVELQAVVQAEDEPPGPESITILGILIDTSNFEEAAGDDDSDFEGEDDSDLTRAQFYAVVHAGQTVVKAKGELVNGGVQWEEVELEGEDD